MVEQKGSFGSSAFGAITYIALGVAALVISQQYKDVTCGTPPAGDSFQLTLQQWVFGTGIAYLIIGLSFSVFALILVCTIIGIIPLVIIWIFSGLFILCWSIVGGISLWKYGGDCQSAAYSLWAMAMAAEIITLVMIFFACCCGGGSAKKESD